MNDLQQDLDIRFKYHKPCGGQLPRYVEIRTRARDLAAIICTHCPDSRERHLAVTKLEEVVMWANAAIARREGDE